MSYTRFIRAAICAVFFFYPAVGLGQDAAEDGEDHIDAITVFGRIPDDTVRDIPQSVAVFDQEILAISPVVSVGDAIRFVPTASRNGSTLNAFGDSYIIRGFDASQTVNGLGFNRIAHARDIANVERIEVLKGPASVLYGQMQPGAVVNVVTKQPLDEFQAVIGAEYGRYQDQRYTLDITGPIANRVRGRLNVAYRNTESFIDFWDLEHFFLAPNLTVDITSDTTLIMEGVYSTNDWGSFQNGTPAQGAFLPNPNGEYPRSFNPDEPDTGFTRRDSIDANFRLIHAFSEAFIFRASYTYTRNEADFEEMFVSSSQPDFVNDFRTLRRAVFFGRDAFERDDNILVDVTGEFVTGPLTHKFVVGFNYRDFNSSRPARFVGTTPLDLFEPVYGLAPDLDPELPDFFQFFDSLAFFVQDRISFGEKLHLLIGVRYSDSDQNTDFITVDGQSFPRELNENDWSTQFGLLYHVSDQFTVYANRAESFVPQFGTSSGGAPFDAERGTQYEVGTRLEFANSGIQMNAAAFIITKTNLRTSDPDNPGFPAALGKAESRGFEVSLFGNIAPNWFLGAAYGFTDTEITRNFDGLEGNTLRNTPKNTVSVQTRYDIESGPLRGLGLGGTLEYVESRFGNDANTFKLPGHARLDLAAYYAINERIQLDFLVNNVFDEDIYAEGFNIFRVIAEPGRTFLARVKLRLD